jgi:acyl-CoA thioesterase
LSATKQLVQDKQTRTFSCHFLSASVPGPASLNVSLEKTGRTLTTAITRLVQADRTIAISVATFANSRQALTFNEIEMPVVPAPEEIPAGHVMGPGVLHNAPFRDQYDQRLAIGPRPAAADGTTQVGGWARFRDPGIIDDLALLAISDSWFPSMHAKTDAPVHAPTIDHTVHFLHPLPTGNPGDFVLVAFETKIAGDGFLIEDGLIWSESGTLLVRCRQLAIILDHD